MSDTSKRRSKLRMVIAVYLFLMGLLSLFLNIGPLESSILEVPRIAASSTATVYAASQGIGFDIDSLKSAGQIDAYLEKQRSVETVATLFNYLFSALFAGCGVAIVVKEVLGTRLAQIVLLLSMVITVIGGLCSVSVFPQGYRAPYFLSATIALLLALALSAPNLMKKREAATN